MTIPSSTSWGEVELALNDPPPGVTITNANGGIQFRSDAQTTKPGLKGNLIVNVYAYRDPETMKGRGQRKKPRRLLTALPAIPVEILPAGPSEKR